MNIRLQVKRLTAWPTTDLPKQSVDTTTAFLEYINVKIIHCMIDFLVHVTNETQKSRYAKSIAKRDFFEAKESVIILGNETFLFQ